MFPKAIASPTVVGTSAGKKIVEHRTITIQVRYAFWYAAGVFVLFLAMFASGLNSSVDKLHQAVNNGSTTPTSLTASHSTTSTTVK